MLAGLLKPPMVRVELHSRAVAEAIAEIVDCHAEAIDACRRSQGKDWAGPERRRAARTFARIPLRIWPADFRRRRVQIQEDQPGIATTLDFSARGFALLCDQPLASQFAVAQFDGPRDSEICLLLEIRWMKRKSTFAYILGTQVVGVLDRDSHDT